MDIDKQRFLTVSAKQCCCDTNRDSQGSDVASFFIHAAICCIGTLIWKIEMVYTTYKILIFQCYL